jgi:hypothetical protein
MNDKDQWTMKAAMDILQHQTVDSRLWAEAAEWLLIHGPQEIRDLLLQSSSIATHKCFPELKATGYAPDGQPCYAVTELAKSLRIAEDEAKEIIIKKQQEHGIHLVIDETETSTIQ